MHNEKELLAICRKDIEASLGWGSGDAWNNQDFEDLSDKITDKTSVQLSVSTLKRIWGRVKYDSQPTPATLNALAVYLGFTNWKEYRKQKEVEMNGHGSVQESDGMNKPGSVHPVTGPGSTKIETPTIAPQTRRSIFSTLVRNVSAFRSAAIVVVIVPVLIYFLTGFNREKVSAPDSAKVLVAPGCLMICLTRLSSPTI